MENKKEEKIFYGQVSMWEDGSCHMMLVDKPAHRFDKCVKVLWPPDPAPKVICKAHKPTYWFGKPTDCEICGAMLRPLGWEAATDESASG